MIFLIKIKPINLHQYPAKYCDINVKKNSFPLIFLYRWSHEFTSIIFKTFLFSINGRFRLYLFIYGAGKRILQMGRSKWLNPLHHHPTTKISKKERESWNIWLESTNNICQYKYKPERSSSNLTNSNNTNATANKRCIKYWITKHKCCSIKRNSSFKWVKLSFWS